MVNLYIPFRCIWLRLKRARLFFGIPAVSVLDSSRFHLLRIWGCWYHEARTAGDRPAEPRRNALAGGAAHLTRSALPLKTAAAAAGASHLRVLGLVGYRLSGSPESFRVGQLTFSRLHRTVEASPKRTGCRAGARSLCSPGRMEKARSGQAGAARC